MANKKSKRPKHTNLVVPGDEIIKKKKAAKKEEPRLHEVTVVPTPEAPAADLPPENASASPKKAAKPAPRKIQEESLPTNAIVMPKPKKKMSPAKRRRLLRRMRSLALGALVLAGILFFATGSHILLASRVADTIDGFRIATRPGDGFPMEFGLTGFMKSKTMQDGGFVALGSSEAVMVSSSGAILRTVQHNYILPGLSTGSNRMVLYSRGGKEYTVESRTRTLAKGATEQEILFCEMSPGGWLALVTSSRYRSTLEVYGPAYTLAEPLLTWPLVDEKPILAAFYQDNKSLLLGCLSNVAGVQGTTIYMLRTDKNEVQGSIRVEDATLLHLRYIENHKVLAVFDKFAAIYNSKGEELTRFSYQGRRLLTAELNQGMLGLVFGATSGEEMQVAVLDKNLNLQFDVPEKLSGQPKILPTTQGAFVLVGQDLLAFTSNGGLADRQILEDKALGLGYASQPLLFLSGRIEPLESLLQGQQAKDAAQSQALETQQPSSVVDRPDPSWVPASSSSQSAVSESASASESAPSSEASQSTE